MVLSRKEIAARVAQDIPDGSYANLGIGIPTLVADFIPEGREVTFHTENGLLGMGPAAEEGHEDPDLINAGKIYVTEGVGASYFHHADSFAMMRGGHLDVCVMGAYQVSVDGDLANWRTDSPSVIPGVGGAMDLASGARRVFVIMDLFSRSGECKLVRECSYPLTGKGCVERVYTDIALFETGPDQVLVLDIFDGSTIDSLAERTGLELVDGRNS